MNEYFFCLWFKSNWTHLNGFYDWRGYVELLLCCLLLLSACKWYCQKNFNFCPTLVRVVNNFLENFRLLLNLIPPSKMTKIDPQNQFRKIYREFQACIRKKKRSMTDLCSLHLCWTIARAKSNRSDITGI